MSQRTEKVRRQVDQLRADVDALQAVWLAQEHHAAAELEASAERARQAHRRAREAKAIAQTWRRNAILALILAGLTGCVALAISAKATEEPTIPPESNPFDMYDFQYNKHNYLYCLKQESYVGVDVSAFQHDINWKAVKQSGVDFAMLRLGYRGWGAKGTLVEDEYIQKNLQGTLEAGMPIGVYFFSQATSINEVYEEIEFMLDILGDRALQYPIVLDWEIANPTEGRTKNVDRRLLTDMLRYFCDEMASRGYDAMIYFNWTQASKMLYLNELEEYPFWLALYQDRMTFPFRVEMWQYTSEGTVPGIEGEVDINVYIPDLTKVNYHG